MNIINVIDSPKDMDLKMEIHGNRKYGAFTEIRTPYSERLTKMKDDYKYYGYNDEDFIRKVIFDVKNKVYKVIEYSGGALERSDVEYYTNKAYHFTDDEMRFLPNYKNRFLYCQNTEYKYVYDNKENCIFIVDDGKIKSQKDFERICNNMM